MLTLSETAVGKDTFHFPDGQLQVEWSVGQWEVLVGLSHLNPVQARHATPGVTWMMPLAL